MEVEILLFPR